MIDGGLRRLFHKTIPAFWTPIETGAVAGGVPDSYFMFPGGIGGFIEYKKTNAFAIKFQPEQISWIDRCVRYGGRVWIIIRQIRKAGPRTTAQDNLFVVSGEHIKLLRREGLRGIITKEELKILESPGQTIIWHNMKSQVWSGGPRFWHWEDIEKLIKS